MMKAMVLLVITVGSTQVALCETQPRSIMLKEQPQQVVTGNLRIDLFGRTELADVPRLTPQEEATAYPRKSPYIAAGLSLVVPGAGQFYTERYWEAAAFFAADVAAWILAYHYDKKGDRQTDFFQNYADANWSVLKYATYAESTYASGRSFFWRTSNDPRLPAWQQVDWNELNRMERYIGSTDPGRYYSHTLPPYGDQQYYELIGKYGQFNPGWDDAHYNPGEYNYLDPVTAHFSYYSGERGKANTYYNTASTWVTVAIINHVVNAVYAGLSAGWYNSAHAELGLQRVPSADGFTNVPVVKIRWEF
ncbi:MAG: DUF5683 domain-containing protein [Bacteroidota bacterium]